MSVRLSRRVRRVSLSANAAAKARATALREAGHDILDLTTGEPDVDTPEHIKQAACAAIAAGDTKYTPTPGVRALREAVQRKLVRENRLDYPLAGIVIANGAKQIIFNAFAATLDEGDEVLVPTPYWPTFPDSVRFNGGVPVFVECPLERGCKLSAAQLEAAIGTRTRWLILNSPGNPSGALYDESELAALAEVLRRHPRVLVMLDELYEHIRFDGLPPRSLLNVAPDLQSRALLVGGVSKTYAMTGWRIGFGAGPEELARAMSVVQSQSASGASSVGQAAALAAFDGSLAFLPSQVASYRERRDLLVAALAPVAGLEVLVPQGGFFVFVRCAGLLGRYRPDGQRLDSDVDVAAYLLEEGVAGVAGDAYGLSPWLRFSIATSHRIVAEAGRRIASACERLTTTSVPDRHQRPASLGHVSEPLQSAISSSHERGDLPMSTQRRRQAIERFLEQVRVIAQHGVDRPALAEIATLLDGLAERRELFDFDTFPAPSAGSGKAATRYRLNDDGETPTLYLNAMLPGRKTIPHNHETWAVIAAVEGQELNRVYRRSDDGSDPSFARLELERETSVEPRAPIAFLGDDIHSIQVDGERPTLHFHLYGRPLESLEGRYGVEADGRILNYNASQMAPSTPAYDL